MLRAMRSSAKYIALVFVTIPFIIWLATAQVSSVLGSNPNVVLSVNGKKYQVTEYQQRVQLASEQYRQQNGNAPVSREEDEQIKDQVVNQMVQDALFEQEYQRLGIRVSDEEVRDMAFNSPLPDIVRDPQFQTDSQFDLRKWQQFLQTTSDQNTLAQIDAIYRGQIPRMKLFQYLTSDVYVSDSKLWRIYKDQHDSVEINVVAVSALLVKDTTQPSDAELADYFKKHQDDYNKLPGIAYVRFIEIPRTPDAADTAVARAHVARVRAELARGAKFEDVAKRESSDSGSGQRGGDLGWVKKNGNDFVAPFMRALRTLKPGQLSAPVESQFGYHLIRIDQEKGDSVKVRHILIPIALQGAHLDRVESRADTLERLAAERTDPTALDTAAKRLGLQVSPEYQVLERQPLRVGDIQVPDVSVWAFEAPVGETSPVIDAPSGYFVFRVDSVIPGGVPTLDQVRPRVVGSIRLERQKRLARGRADSLAAALRQGDFVATAKAHGFQTEHFAFTRIRPPSYLAGEPYVVGVAFGLKPGERSGALQGENAYFIVQSLRRKLADSTAWLNQKETQRQQFRQAAEQARIQQYMEGVRAKAKIVDRRKDLFKSQSAADAASSLQ